MPQCSICGRALSDPVSIQQGIGPVCAGKRATSLVNDTRAQQQLIFDFNGDIVCRRTQQGIEINIPHRYVKHSPTGMDWGYGGSGPADLALNALALYIGRERAERNGLYQEFKWEFIARLPSEGGVIKRRDAINWLVSKGIEKAS